MKNRLLSALLIVALLVSVVPAAGMIEATSSTFPDTVTELTGEQYSDGDPLAAYLSSLDSFTVTPVNPNNTSAVQEGEILSSGSFTEGVILFALENEEDCSRLAAEFAALGLSDFQPVLSEDADAGSDGDSALVWYRATCAHDEADTAMKLRNVSGVVFAELEYLYHTDAFGEPEAAEMDRDWHSKHLLKKSNKFWWHHELGKEIAPGAGTVVAVIDTGVDYTHEDLAANMWTNTAELNGTPGVDDDGNGYIDDIYGVNVTASGEQAGDPMDDNGHGTHVAGIIAMSSNKIGGVGLAWGSKIMAIKAGQSTGTFTSSDIAEAIRYAQMMGADVINMSFGGTEKSYLVEQALSAAFADCVLVASAGNDGAPTTDAPSVFVPKYDIYPAGYSYVLGVMATDSTGGLAGFSNWDYESNKNAEYELTAPGVDIYSTLPGNRYAKWNGTSMAAPCVAAAAAIVRSKYADKDTYSSRFIMGQLASATKDTTTYVDKLGDVHTYAALNIYDSCVNLPKPSISVPEIFALDNVMASNKVNDGDRVVDAGETIDLGFIVRNQWGQTGEITVTADAVSNGGVANPYVTFITDTVTLDPAGTFGESNNGYVWEDSLLTGVSNPIRFKLAANTPNGAEIKINLTVTTTNGVDEKDDARYSPAEPVSYTFRVQNGRGIRGALTENTTLTSDYYWIVENTIYIPEGITLTVEPGTQIQFWSSDYEDAYGGLTMAAIICDGTLNMIGTEENPISCFPGRGFSNYTVDICGAGEETLQYCEIINPRLGEYGISGGNGYLITTVDHCRLTQNQEETCYRYYDAGRLEETTFGGYAAPRIRTGTLSNSAVYGFRAGDLGSYYSKIAVTSLMENVLLNDSAVRFLPPWGANYAYGPAGDVNNSVFMSSGVEVSNIGSGFDLRTGLAPILEVPVFIPFEDDTLYTYAGAESKYLLLGGGLYTDALSAAAREAAEAMGGHLIIINDSEEESFLQELMRPVPKPGNEDSEIRVELACTYEPETDTLRWEDGSSYRISGISTSNRPYDLVMYQWWGDGNPWSSSVAYMRDEYSSYINYVIEIPATVSDEEILAARDAVDVQAAILRNTESTITNNAILNLVLNTDPSTWTTLMAKNYDAYVYGYVASGNYWGTENDILINKMIRDADDYAGRLSNIIETPVLTLESESLEDIYPFSTAVWLEDADGNTVTTVAPGATYKVHVTYNRDMDQATQPTVTYGPAKPYTDFTVQGDWVSAREWVGETVISPVMTNGTQYFRTIGGCAADDKWLVCGNDTMRFSFNVASTGALAMLLQATGGNNRVELSWAQNDYDVLAGYNLYRSTAADGSFSKVNTAIVTGNEYVDTNVEPGVTYYYYFKVVNTEGNEEENQSNVAPATPVDNIAPELTHVVVDAANAGNSVTLAATATDNIAVTAVTLYYRVVGAANFTAKTMTAGANNRYVATIPASAVTVAGVEYYIAVRDGDGNVKYSGTAQIPHRISVDGTPYISGIVPGKIGIQGGATITVLGSNFTEDLVLELGGETVAYSLQDSGALTFTAPAKSIGSYAVTITTPGGVVVSAPAPLAYTDANGSAQIPTASSVVAGVSASLPLYVSVSGELISFHAELDVPSAYFQDITVEKANSSASFFLQYNYSGDKLTISCAGSGNFNPGGNSPLLTIKMTPKAVAKEQNVALGLHNVSCNGAAIDNLISGSALIKPNYKLSATVNYFSPTGKAVSGVAVSAGGVSAVSNSSGVATLLGISCPDVTVIATMTGTPSSALSANDAAVILKGCVGKQTLSDVQKLAGDVDGNGAVNEYDAALILQFLVEKIKVFPSGKSWIFVPASIEKTLTDTTNSVAFTAIVIGDVDGSWEA